MHEKVKTFSSLLSPPIRATSRGDGKGMTVKSSMTLFLCIIMNCIDVFEAILVQKKVFEAINLFSGMNYFCLVKFICIP